MCYPCFSRRLFTAQLIYACVDAAIIFVPMNIRWSSDELRHAMADSNMKMLAVLDKDFEPIAQELSETTTTSWLLLGSSDAAALAPREHGQRGWKLLPTCSSAGGGRPAPTRHERMTPSDDKGCLSSVARAGEAGPVSRHVAPPGDAENSESSCRSVDGVCCIVYTSGTTGRSKGVALTHVGQVMSNRSTGFSG